MQKTNPDHVHNKKCKLVLAKNQDGPKKIKEPRKVCLEKYMDTKFNTVDFTRRLLPDQEEMRGLKAPLKYNNDSKIDEIFSLNQKCGLSRFLSSPEDFEAWYQCDKKKAQLVMKELKFENTWLKENFSHILECNDFDYMGKRKKNELERRLWLLDGILVHR